MNEELREKLKKGAIVGSFFALALVFYLLNWRTLLVVYVMVVGLVSVLAILIQSGKGGGLAASFGGMGRDSILGVRAATPIAKATYVLLALFVFICILIARMGVVQPAEAGLLDMQESQRTESQQQAAPPPAGPQGPAEDLPAPGETDVPTQPQTEAEQGAGADD